MRSGNRESIVLSAFHPAVTMLAGGGAGGQVQPAERYKHAAGVCDDGAGACGGTDEGTGGVGEGGGTAGTFNAQNVANIEVNTSLHLTPNPNSAPGT
jgi:hypothetical protein